MIVLLAYALIFNADYFGTGYYYFACSIVYSVIGIVSCLLPVSRLLILYATVNLFTAISYFLLNHWFYVMEYIVWDATLNLSLISEVIELMLLLSGASSVFIFVANYGLTNTSKRPHGGHRMAKVK